MIQVTMLNRTIALLLICAIVWTIIAIVAASSADAHRLSKPQCRKIAKASKPRTIKQYRKRYRKCAQKIRRHNHWHARRSATAHIASWYGPGFYGNTMACGGTLTTTSMVIAHKTWRCGKRVTVCYRSRCVPARVMDRGPYHGNRTVDLGGAVASRLRFSGVGTVLIANR